MGLDCKYNPVTQEHVHDLLERMHEALTTDKEPGAVEQTLIMQLNDDLVALEDHMVDTDLLADLLNEPL
jgi:hypothetical protein